MKLTVSNSGPLSTWVCIIKLKNETLVLRFNIVSMILIAMLNSLGAVVVVIIR
jgi:hypothetical protein